MRGPQASWPAYATAGSREPMSRRDSAFFQAYDRTVTTFRRRSGVELDAPIRPRGCGREPRRPGPQRRVRRRHPDRRGSDLRIDLGGDDQQRRSSVLRRHLQRRLVRLRSILHRRRGSELLRGGRRQRDVLLPSSSRTPAPCGSLTEIACGRGPFGTCGTRVSFPVAAGVPVTLRVGGVAPGYQGAFQLAVSCGPAPLNDVCANAIPLQLGMNGSFSNVGASEGLPGPVRGNLLPLPRAELLVAWVFGRLVLLDGDVDRARAVQHLHDRIHRHDPGTRRVEARKQLACANVCGWQRLSQFVVPGVDVPHSGRQPLFDRPSAAHRHAGLVHDHRHERLGAADERADRRRVVLDAQLRRHPVRPRTSPPLCRRKAPSGRAGSTGSSIPVSGAPPEWNWPGGFRFELRFLDASGDLPRSRSAPVGKFPPG